MNACSSTEGDKSIWGGCVSSSIRSAPQSELRPLKEGTDPETESLPASDKQRLAHLQAENQVLRAKCAELERQIKATSSWQPHLDSLEQAHLAVVIAASARQAGLEPEDISEVNGEPKAEVLPGDVAFFFDISECLDHRPWGGNTIDPACPFDHDIIPPGRSGRSQHIYLRKGIDVLFRDLITYAIAVNDGNDCH